MAKVGQAKSKILVVDDGAHRMSTRMVGAGEMQMTILAVVGGVFADLRTFETKDGTMCVHYSDTAKTRFGIMNLLGQSLTGKNTIGRIVISGLETPDADVFEDATSSEDEAPVDRNDYDGVTEEMVERVRKLLNGL